MVGLQGDARSFARAAVAGTPFSDITAGRRSAVYDARSATPRGRRPPPSSVARKGP